MTDLWNWSIGIEPTQLLTLYIAWRLLACLVDRFVDTAREEQEATS